MNARKLFAPSLQSVLAMISLLLCTACDTAPPTVPIAVPFGLGKVGESAEFDFRVKEQHGYVVNLEIFFHNKDDLSEREALIEKLGARFAADGSIPFIRIPITLRIRVKSIEVDGPPVDFDHTTDQIGFVSASKEFAIKEVQMQINNQKLQPGTYHIRVENLQPIPEFADRTVRLSVHQAWQGK